MRETPRLDRIVAIKILPQRDDAKAKIAYQDFLTIWKDADPSILILNQAKTEYAKLQ